MEGREEQEGKPQCACAQSDCGKRQRESRHTEASPELTRLPILRLGLFSESQAKTSENLSKDREKKQMASKQPQLGKHLISPQGSCGSSKAGQSYHRMLQVNNP